MDGVAATLRMRGALGRRNMTITPEVELARYRDYSIVSDSFPARRARRHFLTQRYDDGTAWCEFLVAFRIGR